MRSLIDAVGGLADVVILLALVVAVASPALSKLARPLVATVVFVCAWLVTAASDTLRAAAWTVALGGAVIMLSTVVIIVTVHLWTQSGDDGESGPGQRGNHGGGPRHHRPDAPHHGGGGDPSWWPEFEHQLALYEAERDRDKLPTPR
jgi:hypothetical protein